MPLARRTIQYGSIRKPGGGRHARCREARAAGVIGAASGASGGSITDADNPVLCKRLERIDRPIASSFSQTLHGSDSSMSGSLTVADDPGASALAAAVTRTRPYDISTGGEAAA